ncbi:MAG: host attachment protein [Burkholderiales bacterium]|nr:host attachment protein [Burkholderiales bacterium]
MKTTWIVLANAARARIFEAGAAGATPTEVRTLVHPASRLKGHELTEDRPGHAERQTASTAAPGGTGYPPRADPRVKEQHAFAREIAQLLHDALGAGHCARIVLAASNPFLGELRAALTPAVAGAVAHSEPADLTALPVLDLQSRLRELLHPKLK